ncbi:MAG TPA: uracil-DNA glycosylase, partial [Gemmatimonadetes bacterium]|nr:uracil-DNA glycosylase [Gemmatimonadota bacterium]
GLTREQVLRAAGGARREARQPSGLPSGETVGTDPKERGSAELPVPEVASASEVDLAGFEYSELAVVAESCQRCRLAKGRTRVVFSDGNPQARLMVVGEAPGANEDRTGLPFVGQAGKFLDLLLASVDLSRKDSVYICNVLKCRPPGNRDPMADEIEHCSPFLKRQIA